VQALLQDPQGYLGGPGFGSGAYEFVRRMLHRYVNTSLSTIKTVLTTIILALFLANCVQLDFIVNCKTVGQNKNIKENKEAPDKSWSMWYH
jgi:preprotein translocase subunit SecG